MNRKCSFLAVREPDVHHTGPPRVRKRPWGLPTLSEQARWAAMFGIRLLAGGSFIFLLALGGTTILPPTFVWSAEAVPATSPAEPTSPVLPPRGVKEAAQAEAKPAADGPRAPKAAESPLAAGRLIDQEPYDRIFLDAANDHAVLDVFPLDLPGRQVPAKPTQPLVIRLLNRPETKYEVSWSAIAKIELFEQRVLHQAQEYIQQGRFDEAYEYFQYLYEHYPKMVGLDAAYEEALWQEAAVWYQRRQYDRSLAVLRTLWERNKDRPQLDQAMGAAVERLVEQYVGAEDYESARTLLRQLAGWYAQHETSAKWEERLRTEAAAFQTQAKTALEKGDLREASEATRKMMERWPTLPGGAELAQEVRRRYPRVVVGVSLPARMAAGKAPTAGKPPGDIAQGKTPPAFSQAPWLADMADWSARRTSRLTHREWMELVAAGSEGGQYRSPVAGFRIEELGQRLVFQLRPHILDAEGKELTGYRLSEALLEMADAHSVNYRPEWADRVVSVSVQDIYTVEVTLRRAHVRPEALLRFPIAGLAGPYRLLAAQGRETIFVVNPQYFALADAQPKEIVEVAFDSPSQALAALRAGKVDLVDRAPPTELDRLSQSKEIVVSQYAVPVIHVLMPNWNRPLPSHPRFRRALEYAIPREAILRQICGGKELPGFRVLSAPIPLGAGHDDPIGYAYDRSQKVRSYNPRLALALARVAWAEASGTAQALLESPPSGQTASQPSESAGQGTASASPASQPKEVPPQEPTAQKEKSPTEKPSSPSQPPPEKNRPADPFAEEPSDKPTSGGEKPPPAKPPADPFSERTSGTSAVPGAVDSSETSAPADPFAEEPTKEKPSKPSTDEKEKPSSSSANREQPAAKAPLAPPAETASGSKTSQAAEKPSPAESPAAKAGPAASASTEKPPAEKSASERPPADQPSAEKLSAEKPSAGKPSADYLPEMRPLILAHPPTEPARSACRAIRRALRLAGIPVELQEVHPADLLGPAPPEFDLAYLELAIQEPVADLPLLLGQTGPTESGNPFLAVGLAELCQAPGWREVRQALYQLHQTMVYEPPLVPLWQTVEYAAYRKTLQGVGQRPVRLYENVEGWQMVPEPAPSASAKPGG